MTVSQFENRRACALLAVAALSLASLACNGIAHSQERVQRKFFAILGGTAESTDLAKFNLARYLLLRR